MSFLATFGKDFKAVFTWLGSAKGQTVIAAGEDVVESIVPITLPVFTLANSWMAEIIKTESLAAAADSQTGSGVQKAAAVISAVTPQVTAMFPLLPTSQITAASTALVTFLNALGVSSTASTGTTTVASTSATTAVVDGGKAA